jgi:beta-phosphoglucomutase-like phosphatase (HAD superfamily)
VQGIRAGREAGMDVVAVLRGRGSNVGAKALYAVDRFADLGWGLSQTGEIVLNLP